MTSGLAATCKLDTLQQIEVAEGVDILLRPAGPAPRMYAYVLDLLIRAGIFLVLTVLLTLAAGFARGGGAEFGVGIYLLAAFVMEWGYYVYFEMGKRGASPGKRAMGLKVVRTTGTPMTWGASILRNLLRTVDGLPWIGLGGGFDLSPLALVGRGAMLFSKRFQRVGDLLADTLVVYEPKAQDFVALQLNPVVQQQMVPGPPPVALTREEQQAVVLYLERAGVWSDARKEELAGLLQELTGCSGRPAVLRLLSMGLWLRDS